MLHIHSLITKCYHLELSTCSNNVPLSTILYFWIDDDSNFYFISSKKSNHVKNIMINSDVCFSIYNEEYNESVRCFGNAHITDNKNAIKHLLKHRFNNKHVDIILTNKVIVKIVITHSYHIEYDRQKKCIIPKNMFISPFKKNHIISCL